MCIIRAYLKICFLSPLVAFPQVCSSRSYAQACLTSVVHWKRHFMELGESFPVVQSSDLRHRDQSVVSTWRLAVNEITGLNAK